MFEIGNLNSILDKATKENKLIFIDAYTTWCGPCKKMAKEVFTKDTVANYFNSTFINYKLDMEKGEGIEFAAKYDVNCYPNFLIIDGKGNIIHRGAGYLKHSDFIEFAMFAFSSTQNFYTKKAKFEKDGFTEKTILEYISLMNNACLDPSPAVLKYLATVKDDELSNSTNWELIRDNVTDINSREINYLIKNYREFDMKYPNQVESKISKLGLTYFSDYLKSKELDKVAYEKSEQDFIKLNWPYADRIIFDVELRLNKRFNKPDYYAMAAQSKFLTYNANDAGTLNSMAWLFYEEVTDRMQLEAAAKMAQRACELEGTSMHLDTYAAVLYKLGNYKEAELKAELAIEVAKKYSNNPEDYKETTELLKKIKAKLKG